MVGIAQLVERQVVALEVEGSSPSSYPINSNVNTLLKLNFILKTINIKQLQSNSMLSYYNLINLNNDICVSSTNKKLVRSSNNRLSTWTKTSFKLFTQVSLYNRKKLFRPHHTFNIDGYINSGENGGFSNVKLFYSAYKKFYYLIYTMLYFNVPYLIFSNAIFREESCSLNWEQLSSHLFIWKYNYHTLFYRPSKLDDRLPMVFSLFKQSGITASLIIDSLYHSKTIYYLHRHNIYSVGFVEGNKPKHIVNSSLPALGDTLLSQLFFVRSFITLKKIVAAD